MLASAVGGLLTRTLVSSQVECVTENASVYSFYMLMWLLCDFKAKTFFFLFLFFPEFFSFTNASGRYK